MKLNLKTLHPLYIITGDEIFFVEETCQKIIAAAVDRGFEKHLLDISPNFNWPNLHTQLFNLSLFETQQIFELRFTNSKISEAGKKLLISYSQHPPESTILILRLPKVDAATQKTQWFKTLAAKAIHIPIYPFTQANLVRWIAEQIKLADFTADIKNIKQAADAIEGNVLAAKQMIERLKLLHKKGDALSAEHLDRAIIADARLDLFECIDSALSKNTARALTILNKLRAEGEEPVLILWAFAREIRVLISMAEEKASTSISIEQLLSNYKIWEKRKSCVRTALTHHGVNSLLSLLKLCANIDLAIKGASNKNYWQLFEKMIVAC